MAHSSRYKFDIGDRVRNRYSSDEGRVSNVTLLADGTLLVTVAIFVAGLFTHQEQVKLLPGTVGGPWEVVSKVVAAGASAAEGALRPSRGLSVASAGAEARAISDDVVKATMQNVITERLNVMTKGRLDKMMRGVSPSLEFTSAEAASDALQDWIKDFERKRDAVFKYKGNFDVHLDYLSSPGTVNGQGQWMGGYLADIVHGRRHATANVLRKTETVERILAKTKISPELRGSFGSLIPGEVTNAYDLLLHFRTKLDRLPYGEASYAWREYAAVLSQAVRNRPGYQRLQAEIERMPAMLDEVRYQQRLALANVPGAENWADPRRDISEFADRGGTREQTTWDVGRRTPSEVKQSGLEVPDLDVATITRIQREQRLAAQNQRAGLTPRSPTTGRGAERFYPKRGPGFANAVRTKVGTVIEYNRVPHIISAIDSKTLKVTMTPVGSDAVLYSKGILNNTEEMAGFTRRLASRGFQKADTVTAAARELSNRVAKVKSVRVQGGLLGTVKGGVDVPVSLLHSLLAGEAPTSEAGLFKLLTGKEMASPTSLPAGTAAAWGKQVGRLQEIQKGYLHQEMQRLGIHNLSELKSSAQKYGHRFRNLIGIPYEQIGETRKLVENADILSTAHLQAGVQLRQVRGGMTMGELTQNVAGRVRRTIMDDVRVGGGLQIEQVSQITKAVKGGELLTGVEAVDRMGAQNIFQAATETPNRTRMLRTELEHRLRVQAASAGQDPLAVFRQVFGDLVPGQAAPDRPDLGRFISGQRLADWTTRLGGEFRAGRGQETEVLGSFQALAEALNIELVQGSSDLNRAYRELARARQKAGGQTTPAVRRAAKQLALLEHAEFGALDAARALQSNLDGPMAAALGRPGNGFSVDAENRNRTAQILNPLIEAGETGDFSLLHEAGLQYQISTKGRIEVQLHGRQNFQDPYSYFRTGEETGYARNRRGHVVPFGMDAVTLNEHEIEDLMQRGSIHTLRSEGGLVTGTEFQKRLAAFTNPGLEAQIKEQTLQRGQRLLPLLQTEDGLRLGFQAPDPINVKSVIERTRELAQGKGRMIGLDIETDIHTGQLLNVHAQHYELQGGKAVKVGERLDLAVPEFFAQDDRFRKITDPLRSEQIREAAVGNIRQAMETDTVTAATRTITKNGHAVVIDSLVRDEREIVRQTAAYLKRNQETIAGWNIGFDLKELTASALRLGVKEEFDVLHGAAGTRLADMMLLAQAAKPQTKEFGLEAFYRMVTGKKEVEAHVGGPDVDWTMQVLPELLKEAGVAERRLASAEQIRLKETQYIWDREQRRAFQMAGVLDSRKAAELYRAETGENISSAVGVALQPIDFTTGKAEGPLEFRAAKTPHGFGGAFYARHDLLENKAALQSQLEETAADLARRRVRRFMPLEGDKEKKAFTTLLLEEERVKLLDPLAKGELGQAQWGLLQRSRNAESAAERELAAQVHGWSNKFLNDSRMVRQLQLEQSFMQGEVTAAHGPVVDWLKAHLQSAGAEGLRSAQEQANDIWATYIRQAHQLEAFPQIKGVEIPLSQRRVSLDIGILADDPRIPAKVGISVGSQERAERDVQNLVQRIAKRLDRTRPNEMAGLLQGATPEDVADFRRRLRAGKNILDTNLGPTVERHIHEQYILPAVRQGQFHVPGMKQEDWKALQIQATSMAEALPQVVSQGQIAAQSMIEHMPENLIPRGFQDRTALEQLQQQYISRPAADIHRRVAGAENLVLSPQHTANPDWVGKPAQKLVQQALELGEEAQGDFKKSLRYAARNMGRLERQQLNNVLLQQKPSWIDEVMHIGAGHLPTPEVPFTKGFDPGIGHRLGIELSEKITENRGSLKKLGIGALILGGGLLAIRAVTAPGEPPPEDQEPNGIASTEAEVERRNQRILRQQLLTHKVRVNVTAEDPAGVDHQQITDSIHQALGSFFGREIAHQADVTDHRRPMTRDYLDRVAQHLFSEKRPGTPIPA